MKEKLKEINYRLFGNGGLFHNRDGTVSDRLVWVFMILTIVLGVSLFWSFGDSPKPEYAFRMLSCLLTITLPTLIGCQSVENYTDKKFQNRLDGRKTDETEEGEAK